MTWLAWRQSRAQTIAVATALAVLAAALAVTGPNLIHLFDAEGIATCNPYRTCGTLADDFQAKLAGTDAILYGIGIVILLLAPGLLGVFWGAPMVTRELEARTFPLAWNQSVTRTQWMAVKLGLVGLLAMATAGLLSLMLTWWSSPIDTAIDLSGSTRIDLTRLGPTLFAARDITPVGYAAFGLALGVTAGLLLRRTVPAMAATLVCYAFVQFAWPIWIREHLITPAHTIVALDPANVFQIRDINNVMTLSAMPTFSQQGAWVLSSQIVGPSGRPARIPAYPPCMSGSSNAMRACLARIGSLHLRQVVAYEPASRFWEFQWTETAIFVATAVALAGFCIWRISAR